jgi:hypothetical protein
MVWSMCPIPPPDLNSWPTMCEYCTFDLPGSVRTRQGMIQQGRGSEHRINAQRKRRKRSGQLSTTVGRASSKEAVPTELVALKR